MITLHHCADARSFRCLWTLEEMRLPYTLRMLPFPPRQKARDFLALNPLGTIPLLVDGDTRMTESAAICHYLATRHGPSPLAVAPEEAEYGAYLNWLHFGEATLTFPQTLVYRYRVLEPEERRVPQAATDYARWFLARLRAVEASFDHPFLCAGRFTNADISVGFALMFATRLGLLAEASDRARAWWDAIRLRDGFLRAKAAQAEAATAQGVA